MYLTEEQTAFVASIKKMVDRHIAPIAAEIDETDRFPEELVPIFGDMGLLQQWVPEEYGGPGGNLTMLCLAKHEIAKVSMACSILAGQNSIGMALPVLHFGTEEQKRRFLPLSAKGRTLTAVAMSEPHCGSDVAAMKTKAVRDGSSYVINGQ
jgi:alkylation response protein AidB-like acyl-CoA dehydrogenase